MNAVIATSLIPERKKELQIKAISSWKDIGFDIVSFNAEKEIGLLQDFSDLVSFKKCEHTAEELTGKPVVFIDDILKYFSKGDFETAGIVNSDILFKNDSAFINTVTSNRDSLIAGRRIDVDSFENIDGENYSNGFDFFFMPTETAKIFDKSSFCLGMPFWDYWLPLVALLNNVPLKIMSRPVAYHEKHETVWDDSIFIFMHILIEYIHRIYSQNIPEKEKDWNFLISFVRYNYGYILQQAKQTDNEEAMKMLSEYYDRFNEFMVHYIYDKAENI